MTLTEEPVFLPSIKSREEAKHKWDINDNSLPLVSIWSMLIKRNTEKTHLSNLKPTMKNIYSDMEVEEKFIMFIGWAWEWYRRTTHSSIFIHSKQIRDSHLWKFNLFIYTVYWIICLVHYPIQLHAQDNNTFDTKAIIAIECTLDYGNYIQYM